MAKEENYFDKPPVIRKGDENDRAYGKSHLKSSLAKSKAMKKVKYAPSELKTIGQNYKKLFNEQRYVDNRSSRRKHAREYDKEHGTKDNR